MSCKIVEESLSCLISYGQISNSFLVEKVFLVTPIAEAGGYALEETAVEHPFNKDYDTLRGNAPSDWASRWDVTNWAVLSATVDGIRVGGAVLAMDTEGIDMLEGRRDLAVLWDIRVAPSHRNHGVGRTLFRSAETVARRRNCRQIKVETQNINVVACRFYAKQGCSLRSVCQNAYADHPEEIQILWYKELL